MNTDAVVYVIDSQDDENFEISKSEFHQIIANQNLKNSVILIFANKQDLSGAKNINKIIDDYELNKIKIHIWHIQSCSAIKGDGLLNGIKWLSDHLVFRGKNNFPNNPYIIGEEDNEYSDKNKNSQTDKSDIALTINNVSNSLNNNIIREINNIEDPKNNENIIDTSTQKESQINKNYKIKIL